MGRVTWLDIVEAAYDIDSPEDAWLRGIAQASSRMLDDGFGVFAFAYDASVWSA